MELIFFPLHWTKLCDLLARKHCLIPAQEFFQYSLSTSCRCTKRQSILCFKGSIPGALRSRLEKAELSECCRHVSHMQVWLSSTPQQLFHFFHVSDSSSISALKGSFYPRTALTHQPKVVRWFPILFCGQNRNIHWEKIDI